MMLAIGGQADTSVSKTSPIDSESITADYHPIVRLRKLHLVRPDLILYPLVYEVYC